MQTEVEQPNKLLDIVKWSVAVLLLVFGIIANYYFDQQALLLRVICWMLLASVILFIAFQTAQGKIAWHFFREATEELKKMVWPSRKETVQITMIVIAIIIIFGLIMWGIDSFLMWIVKIFTGQVQGL